MFHKSYIYTWYNGEALRNFSCSPILPRRSLAQRLKPTYLIQMLSLQQKKLSPRETKRRVQHQMFSGSSTKYCLVGAKVLITLWEIDG